MIQNLRDIYYLLKNRGSMKNLDTRHKGQQYIKIVLKFSKNWDKPALRRRLLTEKIKLIRKTYPYQVKDYSTAKQLYDEYFERPDRINKSNSLELRVLTNNQLKKSTYIYRFRHEIPVKGERWEQYFIDSNYRDIEVLKVKITNLIGETCFQGENAMNQYCTIDVNELTQYVWATEEQIAMYQEKEKRFQELSEQRETVLKELREIDYKLADLRENEKN